MTDDVDLRERVWSVMHAHQCNEEPSGHSWREHLPWDAEDDALEAEALADALILATLDRERRERVDPDPAAYIEENDGRAPNRIRSDGLAGRGRAGHDTPVVQRDAGADAGRPSVLPAARNPDPAHPGAADGRATRGRALPEGPPPNVGHPPGTRVDPDRIAAALDLFNTVEVGNTSLYGYLDPMSQDVVDAAHEALSPTPRIKAAADEAEPGWCGSIERHPAHNHKRSRTPCHGVGQEALR